VLSFKLPHNVLRLGEGGDFQHSLSYEAHISNFTTNCLTKHEPATFAKPLLPAGVCRYVFAVLLVKKAISEYTALMIRRLNIKLISVSLTECDLLSMSIKT